MSGIQNETNANPLDAGANVNSVESAAQGFTELLSEENRPAPRSSGRRRPQEEDDTLFPEAEVDPEAVPDGDDGHAPTPRRAREASATDEDKDPILDDAEGDEGDQDENSDGDEDDEDAEGDEGDEDENPDDDDHEIDPDREFEIVVDGETQSVKFSELIAGYSREADYRQKTAQLAEERREVEEFAASVVQQRNTYVEGAQEFINLAEAMLPSEDEWNTLKTQNPQLYIQTKEQWDGILAKVDQAKAKIAEANAQAAEEETRQYTEWVRQQNRKLEELVPALRNPKKAKAFRDAIFTYGRKAGYSDEELVRGAVDARDVLTLYKASRYDQIMESRRGNAKNPGRKKSPAPAINSQPRSVTKQRNKGNFRQLRDADRRLARSGSVDDAAMAFTRMIES